MKTLVVGGNGFIGKQVTKILTRAEHDVVGMDIVWTGEETCERMLCDITQPLPRVKDVDAIIHLAAIASPQICDADPERAMAVNVAGMDNVLKMALASGVKKVVFPSTAHVYGISPRYLPTDEQHPIYHQSPYTLSKILGEQLCRLYFENHGLNYTILRLFNVYGAGQADGFFLPDMLTKAKAGRIDLAAPETTKDWIHVSDVERAFSLAAESAYVGVINIGTGRETSLGTIAKMVAEASGAEYHEHPGTATRMCADNGRAKRILGWEPKMSLFEGLRTTLEERGLLTKV